MYHFQFTNKDVQKQYNEKGYAVLPMLKAEEVEKLLTLYQSVNASIKKENQTIYTTGEHIDKQLALETHQKICSVIETPLQKIIKNYEALMAAFIVKSPNQEAKDTFDWHQDLSFVDESKYQSAQVWIALQDTHQKNGAIEVIEHSHLYNNYIRSAPWFPNFFEKYMHDIVLQKKEIHLKAGEVIIFNHRLLHSSPPNTTQNERLAILMSIKVPEAEWLYYTYDRELDTLKKYDASQSFFLDLWINKEIQEEKCVLTKKHRFPHIEKRAFLDLCKKNNYALTLLKKFKLSFH
jgi:ectoine hydroxylase-related dioxygenase (phytanoyl-CoA dioxygenase family)